MCPFIVQNTDQDEDLSTRYLVFTSPMPEDKIVPSIMQYAHLQSQKGQRILVFDGSLGLGDIGDTISLKILSDIDGVLQKGLSLSTLIQSHNNMDVITGSSKTTNLGKYNAFQLQNLFQDLKLLGSNYRQVIIYAPASLPKVQDFFCKHCSSICMMLPEKESISATTRLIHKYPQMKCYAWADKKYSPKTMLQIELMIDPAKILLHLP